MISAPATKQIDPNQYQVRWFDQLELLAASKHKDGTGRLLWRFPVLKEYLQAFSTYAGGAQAAAHDNCTGWALLTIAKPGHWAALGSSRTLNISYLAAAQEGDVLLLEAKVRALLVFAPFNSGYRLELSADVVFLFVFAVQIVSIGSRMAMIRGTLTRERDGQLISTSEHHLHNNDVASASCNNALSIQITSSLTRTRNALLLLLVRVLQRCQPRLGVSFKSRSWL